LYYLILVLFFFPWTVNANGLNQKISLPLNEWVSQRVLTKVVGQKITQLGFDVDYVEISSLDQLGALRKGIVHLQVELWRGSESGSYMQALKKGLVVDVGAHSAVSREDWWYPDYVEQKCIGLPNWQAMNKCSNIFSTEEDKGIYYSGPCNYRDGDLIRALELNFTIEKLKSTADILDKIKDTSKHQMPIVIFNWSPNWVDVRMSGKFIEFPAFDKQCEKSPEWGINKHLINDCGNPTGVHLRKAAWPGLEKTSPCIFKLLSKIDFTNEMIAEASALVDYDGYSEKKAVALWLDKYAEKNSNWLLSQCNTGN
jgi:glycine betaine/proline transport system substrate-binding protein